MSKKVNVIFEGQINDFDSVQKFQALLITHGSKVLQIVNKLEDANIKVDISDINGSSNLMEEAIFTINAAKSIGVYEKKRKRIFKKIAEKTLLASSRKYIN